jgi:peptidyl-prolyl cis-trans isomerase SurA
MKLSVLIIILLTCLSAQAQSKPPVTPVSAIPGRVQTLDSVAALVNSEVITRSQLRLRLARVERQLTQQGVSLPPRELLERQVLERMIVDKLQAQLAREQGIRVDDTTLDRTLGRIAEQNRMNLQQFRDRLERDGISFSTFRNEVRDEILTTRLREREVERRIQISEADIDHYLKQQQNTDTNTEVNLGQILVRIPEGASAEVIAQRRARAEQLLSQLKNGAEFTRLAASNSDGFEATRGGEMGLRPLDRYPQLFIDAVRNLKTGDITPVLQSPAGFHILRVIEQRGNANPVTAQVQQTRARHILLRNADGLTDEEAQRRLNDYKQRIDSKAASFDDLARRFSRDGSATQGGDLGWLYPGDTVPEFERAMDALQPGQVSAPVQSPFGWHLIEVTERRTSEVGNDRKRLIARQAVREQKLEEATEDWLRELRDDAYVEIRLDN